MHVALNLLPAAPGADPELRTIVRELVPLLVDHDEVHVTCLVSEEQASGEPLWGQAAPVEVVAGPREVGRAAEQAGADLVHSVAVVKPSKGDVAHVTAVRDLDDEPSLRAVKSAVRRSHLVIVPSDATRRQLVERLGTKPRMIEVVPEAPAGGRRQLPAPEPELRERLGLGARAVVLSTATRTPRANLARLLEALAVIPADERPALVLAGPAAAGDDAILQAAQALGVADALMIVPDEGPAALEGLYALAKLMAFPSLHEGFGLPVLEAMSRGVPVVTSNRSAMPEVAGGAALLVDPESTEAIAGAIVRLLGDADERRRLSEKGIERAARFSWERTAELTVYCYKRAVGIKQLGLD